jgi:hypothetical protein
VVVEREKLVDGVAKVRRLVPIEPDEVFAGLQFEERRRDGD